MMSKPMTTDDFINKAKHVHHDNYDYSCTVYTNMKHKVLIICPKHGEFLQLPQAHLRGQGCPLCGKTKQRKTMLDKYGVDNPMKSKAICEKARETCKAKYGSEWAMSNDVVKSKVESTNIIKYGVSRPLQNDDILSKMKQSNLQKYGVENVGMVSEFRDKFHETCHRLYGVDEPLSSPEIRQKIMNTNKRLYGGVAPLSSSVVKKKCADTCLERYGVEYPSQLRCVVEKIQQTKKLNGTFGTSSIEESMYECLVAIFSVDDVIRQYHSELYPFACDFYVKSRDLYIELNASWTHGGHWFSCDNMDDVQVLDTWKLKSTDYYDNAVDVWSHRDLLKRETAKSNGLNYITFWDNDMRDFELWTSVGCPDAHDYDVEYSWIC